MLPTHNQEAILANATSRYSEIIVIVSPPRCSSTALARVFWEHPLIRYYAHEPFELTYYEGKGLETAAAKVRNPIDILPFKNRRGAVESTGLVIKEMPYQVGERFALLASVATRPLIFLIRDPRLNIASRVQKKIEGNQNPAFPHIESGWELLSKQVAYCKQRALPYVIVDATDFRNRPMATFKPLFAKLNLLFSAEMLRWRSAEKVELDNLGGPHQHLYQRVLKSTGIVPATEPIPEIESFTVRYGLRQHVRTCLATYSELAADKQRVGASSTGRPAAGATVYGHKSL